MVDEFKTLVEVLQSGGPYAVIAALGIAYWNQNKYIQQLHAKILDTSIQNVTAMVSVKSAIDSQTKVLDSMTNRL